MMTSLALRGLQRGDLRQALNEDASKLGWWRGGRSVALDIARGLNALHSCGVVHRYFINFKCNNCSWKTQKLGRSMHCRAVG